MMSYDGSYQMKKCLWIITHYFEFTSTPAASGASGHLQGTFPPRNSAAFIDTITVFINGMVFEKRKIRLYV
jgi:hypothetical protein